MKKTDDKNILKVLSVISSHCLERLQNCSKRDAYKQSLNNSDKKKSHGKTEARPVECSGVYLI